MVFPVEKKQAYTFYLYANSDAGPGTTAISVYTGAITAEFYKNNKTDSQVD